MEGTIDNHPFDPNHGIHPFLSFNNNQLQQQFLTTNNNTTNAYNNHQQRQMDDYHLNIPMESYLKAIQAPTQPSHHESPTTSNPMNYDDNRIVHINLTEQYLAPTASLSATGGELLLAKSKQQRKSNYGANDDNTPLYNPGQQNNTQTPYILASTDILEVLPFELNLTAQQISTTENTTNNCNNLLHPTTTAIQTTYQSSFLTIPQHITTYQQNRPSTASVQQQEQSVGNVYQPFPRHVSFTHHNDSLNSNNNNNFGNNNHNNHYNNHYDLATSQLGLPHENGHLTSSTPAMTLFSLYQDPYIYQHDVNLRDSHYAAQVPQYKQQQQPGQLHVKFFEDYPPFQTSLNNFQHQPNKLQQHSLLESYNEDISLNHNGQYNSHITYDEQKINIDNNSNNNNNNNNSSTIRNNVIQRLYNTMTNMISPRVMQRTIDLGHIANDLLFYDYKTFFCHIKYPNLYNIQCFSNSGKLYCNDSVLLNSKMTHSLDYNGLESFSSTKHIYLQFIEYLTGTHIVKQDNIITMGNTANNESFIIIGRKNDICKTFFLFNILMLFFAVNCNTQISSQNNTMNTKQYSMIYPFHDYPHQLRYLNEQHVNNNNNNTNTNNKTNTTKLPHGVISSEPMVEQYINSYRNMVYTKEFDLDLTNYLFLINNYISQHDQSIKNQHGNNNIDTRHNVFWLNVYSLKYIISLICLWSGVYCEIKQKYVHHDNINSNNDNINYQQQNNTDNQTCADPRTSFNKVIEITKDDLIDKDNFSFFNNSKIVQNHLEGQVYNMKFMGYCDINPSPTDNVVSMNVDKAISMFHYILTIIMKMICGNNNELDVTNQLDQDSYSNESLGYDHVIELNDTALHLISLITDVIIPFDFKYKTSQIDINSDVNTNINNHQLHAHADEEGFDCNKDNNLIKNNNIHGDNNNNITTNYVNASITFYHLFDLALDNNTQPVSSDYDAYRDINNYYNYKHLNEKIQTQHSSTATATNITHNLFKNIDILNAFSLNNLHDVITNLNENMTNVEQDQCNCILQQRECNNDDCSKKPNQNTQRCYKSIHYELHTLTHSRASDTSFVQENNNNVNINKNNYTSSRTTNNLLTTTTRQAYPTNSMNIQGISNNNLNVDNNNNHFDYSFHTYQTHHHDNHHLSHFIKMTIKHHCYNVNNDTNNIINQSIQPESNINSKYFDYFLNCLFDSGCDNINHNNSCDIDDGIANNPQHICNTSHHQHHHQYQDNKTNNINTSNINTPPHDLYINTYDIRYEYIYQYLLHQHGLILKHFAMKYKVNFVFNYKKSYFRHNNNNNNNTHINVNGTVVNNKKMKRYRKRKRITHFNKNEITSNDEDEDDGDDVNINNNYNKNRQNTNMTDVNIKYKVKCVQMGVYGSSEDLLLFDIEFSSFIDMLMNFIATRKKQDDDKNIAKLKKKSIAESSTNKKVLSPTSATAATTTTPTTTTMMMEKKKKEIVEFYPTNYYEKINSQCTEQQPKASTSNTQTNDINTNNIELNLDNSKLLNKMNKVQTNSIEKTIEENTILNNKISEFVEINDNKYCIDITHICNLLTFIETNHQNNNNNNIVKKNEQQTNFSEINVIQNQNNTPPYKIDGIIYFLSLLQLIIGDLKMNYVITPNEKKNNQTTSSYKPTTATTTNGTTVLSTLDSVSTTQNGTVWPLFGQKQKKDKNKEVEKCNTETPIEKHTTTIINNDVNTTEQVQYYDYHHLYIELPFNINNQTNHYLATSTNNPLGTTTLDNNNNNNNNNNSFSSKSNHSNSNCSFDSINGNINHHYHNNKHHHIKNKIDTNNQSVNCDGTLPSHHNSENGSIYYQQHGNCNINNKYNQVLHQTEENKQNQNNNNISLYTNLELIDKINHTIDTIHNIILQQYYTYYIKKHNLNSFTNNQNIQQQQQKLQINSINASGLKNNMFHFVLNWAEIIYNIIPNAYCLDNNSLLFYAPIGLNYMQGMSVQRRVHVVPSLSLLQQPQPQEHFEEKQNNMNLKINQNNNDSKIVASKIYHHGHAVHTEQEFCAGEDWLTPHINHNNTKYIHPHSATCYLFYDVALAPTIGNMLFNHHDDNFVTVAGKTSSKQHIMNEPFSATFSQQLQQQQQDQQYFINNPFISSTTKQVDTKEVGLPTNTTPQLDVANTKNKNKNNNHNNTEPKQIHEKIQKQPTTTTPPGIKSYKDIALHKPIVVPDTKPATVYPDNNIVSNDNDNNKNAQQHQQQVVSTKPSSSPPKKSSSTTPCTPVLTSNNNIDDNEYLKTTTTKTKNVKNNNALNLPPIVHRSSNIIITPTVKSSNTSMNNIEFSKLQNNDKQQSTTLQQDNMVDDIDSTEQPVPSSSQKKRRRRNRRRKQNTQGELNIIDNDNNNNQEQEQNPDADDDDNNNTVKKEQDQDNTADNNDEEQEQYQNNNYNQKEFINKEIIEQDDDIHTCYNTPYQHGKQGVLLQIDPITLICNKNNNEIKDNYQTKNDNNNNNDGTQHQRNNQQSHHDKPQYNQYSTINNNVNIEHINNPSYYYDDNFQYPSTHFYFENNKQQNVNFYGSSLRFEKDYKDNNIINQDNNCSIVLSDGDNNNDDDDEDRKSMNISNSNYKNFDFYFNKSPPSSPYCLVSNCAISNNNSPRRDYMNIQQSNQSPVCLTTTTPTTTTTTTSSPITTSSHPKRQRKQRQKRQQLHSYCNKNYEYYFGDCLLSTPPPSSNKKGQLQQLAKSTLTNTNNNTNTQVDADSNSYHHLNNTVNSSSCIPKTLNTHQKTQTTATTVMKKDNLKQIIPKIITIPHGQLIINNSNHNNNSNNKNKKDYNSTANSKLDLINLNDKKNKHKSSANNSINNQSQHSNDNNNKNKNIISLNTSNTLSNNQSTNTQVFHTPHIIITPCVTNNNTLDICI